MQRWVWLSRRGWRLSVVHAMAESEDLQLASPVAVQVQRNAMHMQQVSKGNAAFSLLRSQWQHERSRTAAHFSSFFLLWHMYAAPIASEWPIGMKLSERHSGKRALCGE